MLMLYDFCTCTCTGEEGTNEDTNRVWLTGYCFFAGIPRFLTTTTSLLAVMPMPQPLVFNLEVSLLQMLRLRRMRRWLSSLCRMVVRFDDTYGMDAMGWIDERETMSKNKIPTNTTYPR